MKKKWIIGSRESRLAVAQTELLCSYLRKTHSELEVEILTMKTTGDILLNQSLEKVGGKGLFVKELDRALIEGRSDLSVHSLKDVPVVIPEELPLLGMSEREDPRDVLVLPEGQTELDFSRPVGCSSKRRRLQFQELYPQAFFEPIRGNVLTRLRKLDEGQYGALLLAAAGLKRLGLESRISRYFSEEEMIPAVGQGILAVQGRKGTDTSVLQGFFDEDAERCARAERAVVQALGGDCSTPAAAFAQIRGEELTIRGFYLDESSGMTRRASVSGSADNPEEIGFRLAEQLTGSGGQ